YSDFNLQTRSKTLQQFISSHSDILKEARSLLYQEELNNSVRLLGISLSNLNTEQDLQKEEETVSVQLQFEF
ncbi:MAG: DNA polymerase IV, partial [Eudoraea sp.]|nr:DNA polymerase IV [Eudoraea sp.]